jgi:primosomal protein N' (replication factor Y)
LSRFYEVFLLERDVILTYKSESSFSSFQYVRVPVQNKISLGILFREVKELQFPEEKLKEIVSVLNFHLPKEYFKTALFIKNFYFNSLSQTFNFFPKHLLEYPEPHQLKIPEITLSKEQEKAFREIGEKVTLLFGDTGSGKTHIYKKLIADVLRNGGDILFLVPEINLVPQTVRRVREQFGDIVAPWHSKVRKDETLQNIYSRKVRIVIGTLSSIFVPFANLKLIIVDEEHSESYILNSSIHFNARDIAIYLANLKKIPIVLGSATPSLNSYYKFHKVRLLGNFFKGEKSYIFENGDMDISERVLQKISSRLEKREQTIIFVPTRGNFKYVSCNSCGYKFECPNCSVKLSLYKDDEVLRCNRCDFEKSFPESCKSCGNIELEVGRVGTAEVVKILKSKFKKSSILNFDSDRVRKEGVENILEKFRKKEIDILVGTQMISKGHDYPAVTLSIILGIDYLLNSSDFKSLEKSIALVTQIGGRSGRNRDSEVLIQTKYEELYKSFIGDFEKFLQYELKIRKGKYPPFKEIFKLEISHSKKESGEDILNHLELFFHFFSDFEILYSGKSGVERENKIWRFETVLRGEKIGEFLKEIFPYFPNRVKKYLSVFPRW